MVKVKNFYVPKVDSLRISIPFERSKVIDKTLFEKLITVHESTGEIINQKDGAPYIHETSCGLFWKIWIQKRNLVEGQARELIEEIHLLVNAKHLKSRYFEGITKDNIHLILEEINALNIVKLTLGDLLKSQIGDVDLCFDFPVNPDVFRKVIDRYGELVQVRKQDVLDPPFKGKMNLGRQFNKRDKQTPAKPYCKFYFKTYELDSKSLSFSDKYLTGVDYSNIGRFELNLKNRKTLKYYQLENVKTLNHLFSLSERQARMVFKRVYQNWFLPKPTIKREVGKWWYLKHLDALYNEFDSGEEVERRENAVLTLIHSTECCKIRKKIMDAHNKLSNPIEVETPSEIKSIQTQLDMFFGVNENRTYDVRENMDESSTKRSQSDVQKNLSDLMNKTPKRLQVKDDNIRISKENPF